MASNNFGQTVYTSHNSNIIDDGGKTEMSKVHLDGNKAKHANWDTGNMYMLDASKDAYSKGIISKEAYELCLMLNDVGNDAKHEWN